MNKKIMFIMGGKNGATYILNATTLAAINNSLKFYKARTLKQKLFKLALKITLVFIRYFPKLPQRFELKTIEETSQYFSSLTGFNLAFSLDDNCSALVSPTRDKIIVHHHARYFHKFAFGRSQDKVKSEVGIYKRIGTEHSNFSVSEMVDVYETEDYCSFKLTNTHHHDGSKLINIPDLVAALVELFNITSGSFRTIADHLHRLQDRLALLDPAVAKMLNTLLIDLVERNGDQSISLGLVHRDFKPWNINDEKGLLIYDFEEAVLDGPPLEDLFNYFIDPMIRYTTTQDMAAAIFDQDKVALYRDYLQRLEVDVDFQVLLGIYLVERVVFWAAQGELETASKYIELVQYLEGEAIKDKKKLVMIHLLNDYSGSPKVMSQVITACQSGGYSMDLYTGHRGEGFLTDICERHYRYFYKRSKNKYLVLLAYLSSQFSLFFKLLKYRKDDVVLYVNTMLPFGAALAGKLTGKPVYYHIHEISIQPKGLKRFLRFIVQHTAEKVIFVSQSVLHSESFRNMDQRVVYNALPAQFVSKAEENAYRWKPAAAFSVLMVGSLKDYKGLPEFIEIARLCEAGEDVKFTLVLNADSHEIDGYFSNLDLPKNVELVARQSDLVPFYRNTSLLMNLSRPDEWVETFGLTILEAMAFGIPVIVPPIGGPIELVTDGVEGYLLSCYEHSQVAARIQELASDEEKCRELSERARMRSREFSEENFNAEIVRVMGE